MKRINFYTALMLMAFGMAAFSSCSSDDDDVEQIPESGDVVSFNQVKYLQNNIVETDSLGNMVQRVYGTPLNPSDTTELYVGVESIDEASELFKNWLSSDTEVKASTPSATDMQASLKDENGDVKETVYFKAVEGDDEIIAEVTFASKNVFKHFSKLLFIKRAAWPSNSNGTFSPYYVGDMEWHDTYDDGSQRWVCIRAAKQGQAGLLMYISSHHGYYGIMKASNFATPSLAKEASNVIKGNWNMYVTLFREAGRTLESGSYYWINDWKYMVGSGAIYAIRLSDGDIDWFDIVWRQPDKHFIQIRTFGLVEG